MDTQFTILLKISDNEDDLEISTIGGHFGDPEFYEAIKCFKKVGGEYDKDTKKWIVPIESAQPLVNQIDKHVADCRVCGWNCNTFEEFLEKVNKIVSDRYKPELIRATTRRIFDPSLMHFPPLKGIHPFEDFQKQDITRALNQNRFLFNWEMGLGKSYATVALFDHLVHYGCIEKAVLLTTGIGTFNLKNEFLKFSKSLNDEDIVVCRNTAEARKFGFERLISPDEPHKIFITTYSVFKTMDAEYYKAVSDKKSTKKSRTKGSIPFDEWSDKSLVLFLDESHNVANTTSLQTKVVTAHKKYFDYIYEFTGTFADKYEKIYSQIKILDASLVGGKNFQSWVLDYGDIGTKFSDYAPNPAAWNIDKLNKLNDTLVRTYSAKRRMDECLDLPLDYEVPTFTLKMGDKHRKLYQFFIETEMERIKQEAKEQGKSVISVVLNQFSWLQSACENPNVLKNTKRFNEFPVELQALINNFNYLKDNSKIPLFDEIIEERCDDNDQKGIIWCTHPDTIERLAEHYKKYNPVVITKDTEDKFKDVEKFKQDKKSKLLITSIYVLNSSVTITEAKFNLYAERCFNFTLYSQSRGRIHRPGKTELSRTYQMVFDKSTDCILDMNLAMKGQMIDRLLTKDFFTQKEWSSFFNHKYGASLFKEDS